MSLCREPARPQPQAEDRAHLPAPAQGGRTVWGSTAHFQPPMPCWSSPARPTSRALPSPFLELSTLA